MTKKIQLYEISLKMQTSDIKAELGALNMILCSVIDKVGRDLIATGESKKSYL